ncbi:MAG: hypothetical protein ABSF90_26620 [Syntrophobacteraceae bacterium]|jgi:hypothetical protein
MKDKKEEPLKPKASAPQVVEEDISLLEDTGCDRITEKLSIGVPTQPLLRPTGLNAFYGKQVRLLLRDGSIITGFLQKRLFDFVYLLNIVEIGTGYKLTADWCAIDLSSIARAYPANAKVEKISKP